METKKNPRMDLSRQSKLFFNIGLVISLSLCIAAFEWKTYGDPFVVDLTEQVHFEEDTMMMPIVDLTPKLEPPKTLEKIKIVKDDTPVTDEIEKLLDEQPEMQTTDIVVAPTMPTNTGNVGVSEEKPEDILPPFGLEQQPAPVGGMEAFYKYLSKNLKYPDQARRMEIEGKVFVQFVVDKDGRLSDVKIQKGIGSGCDEEAVRVIKDAPKWTPGKQRGRPVRVRMSIPITFKIPE